ncbi:archease [bacterium]|nr:archease [bacterium]
MEKYKILEHKADLKIRAFGKTKQNLFSNALLAMSDSQRAEVSNQKTKREIKVKSPNLSLLLVDFLSEALYLSQVNKEVYKDVEFKKFSDTEIEAELIGNETKSFGEDIKAITYHDLEIYQEGNGIWQATILFDI